MPTVATPRPTSDATQTAPLAARDLRPLRTPGCLRRPGALPHGPQHSGKPQPGRVRTPDAHRRPPDRRRPRKVVRPVGRSTLRGRGGPVGASLHDGKTHSPHGGRTLCTPTSAPQHATTGTVTPVPTHRARSPAVCSPKAETRPGRGDLHDAKDPHGRSFTCTNFLAPRTPKAVRAPS